MPKCEYRTLDVVYVNVRDVLVEKEFECDARAASIRLDVVGVLQAIAFQYCLHKIRESSFAAGIAQGGEMSHWRGSLRPEFRKKRFETVPGGSQVRRAGREVRVVHVAVKRVDGSG